MDARLFQILFLGLLLGTGVLARDFSLRAEQVILCFAAGLATQVAFTSALGLKRVGLLSAIVTCTGLSILLRADSVWVHPLAAAIAIAAKFVVRAEGRHLFNPANLGVVASLLFLPGAWVSPGQWGSDLLLAGAILAMGSIVTNRARASDISWMFLAAWGTLLGARALWLGQPAAVWMHQMESGALLLFTFFMISDPMTIPSARRMRVAYACLVAGVAFAWQFAFFKPNPLVWALFIATPAVPLFDRLVRGAAHRWRPQETAPEPAARIAATRLGSPAH